MTERSAQTIDARRAIVLGASSGMGAAIVRRFAAQGIQTAALDLESAIWPDDLPAAYFGTVDVTDSAGVSAAIEKAAAALGSADIVVNCAGILGPVSATVDTTPETFARIVNLNLGGAFAVTRAALKLMLPRGNGRIIHIASIAGKEGNPQMAAYSASKAGVIGLVKSVGKEYAASGVTINAIAPASIETPLIQAMTPERREVQKALIPMGRFGTAEEIAGIVSFIASADAAFTTGFVFDASGGRADY